MLGTMARMFLFTRAPKAAFALMYPRQVARVAKFKWDVRHAAAPRVAAIGAAAVALPVGIAIGRAFRRNPANF